MLSLSDVILKKRALKVFQLCHMCQALESIDSTSNEITDKFFVESTLVSDDDLTDLDKVQEVKDESSSWIACVDSFSSIGIEGSLKPSTKSAGSKLVLETPSATVKRRALIRQRQMNIKHVSPRPHDVCFDFSEILKELQQNGKGAYLVFSSGNNGSFFIEWSQTFITNALLFCKPSSDSNIPLYKYSSHAKEELARGIFSSASDYCSAFLLYVRHMRNYNASIQLLPEYAKQAVELQDMLDAVSLGFYHKSSMQVHVLDTQPEKCLKTLQEYQGAIAVRGDKASALLIDLAQKSLTENVSFSVFLSFGSEYGITMTF
ncbi:uncharacterized protein LOC128884434 isoform X2 [Hylaeus volcanicus]|uniref:uncharacterized protein LOC128884434 isoform X2 n=1 Tax=Hylaeus volcanicus TaxID=313075 RepID=UPI0023B80A5B|nr:uncharacterized protein LOC128884434 isoform X2 [Hylaeus volcanicus]